MNNIDKELIELYDIINKIKSDSSLSASDILTTRELRIYEKYASEYLRVASRVRGMKSTGTSLSQVLGTLAPDTSKRGYPSRREVSFFIKDFHKGLFDDEIFVGAINRNKSNISKEAMPQLAFNFSIAKHFGESVDLETLMRVCYSLYKNKNEVDALVANPFAKKEFYDKLNGIIGSNKVSMVDSSKYETSHSIRDIKIKNGSSENPIFFIKSHFGVETMNLAPTENHTGQITVIAISDIHMEGKNNQVTGNSNYKFTDRVRAFSVFEKVLVREMNAGGKKVDAVVFVGDVFEGYCNVENDATFNLNKRNFIMSGIDDIKSRGTSFPLTGSETVSGVCFLAGNHDMTLGTELFEKTVEKLCPDGKFMGNEHVKMSVGKSTIEFSHPASWDYGVQDRRFSSSSYEVRRKSLDSTFQIGLYVDICNQVFNSLPVSQRQRFVAADMYSLVNEKISKENPDLYAFFEPYVVPLSTTGHDFDADHFKSTRGSRAPLYDSLFSKYINFDPMRGISEINNGRISEMSVNEVYSNSPRLQQMLNGRNPLVSHDTMDDVVLSSVGHFHFKKEDEPTVSVKHTKADDFHMEVIEPQGAFFKSVDEGTRFMATRYTLDLKSGFVERMKAEPMTFNVKKVGGRFAVRRERESSVEYSREVDDAFIEEHTGKSR